MKKHQRFTEPNGDLLSPHQMRETALAYANQIIFRNYPPDQLLVDPLPGSIPVLFIVLFVLVVAV